MALLNTIKIMTAATTCRIGYPSLIVFVIHGPGYVRLGTHT